MWTHDKSDSYDLYVDVLCPRQLCGILFLLCATALVRPEYLNLLRYARNIVNSEENDHNRFKK